MNKQKWIILFVALGLMGAAAGLLARMQLRHQLGRPGVMAKAIPGSELLDIPLPESVLDYHSEKVAPDAVTVAYLPKDTSLSQRRYLAPDGTAIALNVVMMGTDRTSIHKPEACMTAQGWTLNESASEQIRVPMQQPHAYDLPVMKLVMSRRAEFASQSVEETGIYMYWFVADDAVTASHLKRVTLMAENLLRTGVLQRWSYIACFEKCAPGQEAATSERMKQFIAAAAPQFQLAAGP